MTNYVGAVYDWDSDKVLVWERPVEGGERQLRTWPAEHYFYAPSEQGTYRSIYGYNLEKLVFDNDNELKAAARQVVWGRHESDIPPLFKCLMNRYYDRTTPIVHYAFIDIEVNYSSKIGFAGPQNPYGIINAVTVYQSWTKKYVTLVVSPIVNGVRWSGTVEDLHRRHDELVAEGKLRKEQVTEFRICQTEGELITQMLELIQDADIISGWNSEFFDLPYIVKRVELVLPRLLQKLCFPGCRKPKERMVERFGSPELAYTLYGRTHLDYLDLFKKFTFEGRESFALGNILQEEVGLSKIHYEGTLEQLYHNDFPTFCCYNFRDVSGMVDLDEKFKFIQLVNQMAHENTCLFENILGTVRYVETGIANRAHYVHNLIVPDKAMNHDGEKVEGALVLNPKIGLHEWIGSVDINSLYPSVIRALNISPEKFRGQFENGEEDWRGIMVDRDDKLHVMRQDDGDYFEATGSQWREIIADQKWVITAYGTVFDESGEQGIVADTLTYWFAERKRLQAEKKKYAKLAKAETDPDKKAEYERLEAHYDLLQLTKKIQLNSTYGALLNVAFRFGRKEMGASVTACGRQITTHMMETIHSILSPDEAAKIVKSTEVDEDGTVQHVYDIAGRVVLYGDTDSCYFATPAKDRDEAIKLADDTAARTNATFQSFMQRVFNCQPNYDNLIKAGREVVAERGLFQAKKKYVLKVIDLEGAAVDKLKSQGSEMKKSDTPKVIQDFLKELMKRILSGANYDEIETFVNSKRKEVLGRNGDMFSVGVAKQANNLDAFYAAWSRSGKKPNGPVVMVKGDAAKATNIPGHIRAAFMYNELVKERNLDAKLVRSGDKVKIFYLKANRYQLKAIAFPADFDRFPEWFTDEFQVDRALTEQKMFDNKLGGIFDALGWEIPTAQNAHIKKILRF